MDLLEPSGGYKGKAKIVFPRCYRALNPEIYLRSLPLQDKRSNVGMSQRVSGNRKIRRRQCSYWSENKGYGNPSRRQIEVGVTDYPKIIERANGLQAATVRALASRPTRLRKPNRNFRIAKLSRGVIRFVPVWHWTVAQIPEPQPAFVFQSRNCQDNPLSWRTRPKCHNRTGKYSLISVQYS